MFWFVFRLNVQFVFIAVVLSLFYILSYFYFTVILFCFICSPLSTVPLQRNQCYPHLIQSRAFSGFQCSSARVAMCPDESLLSVGWNVGVVFTFTTVELRHLLLFIQLAGSATYFIWCWVLLPNTSEVIFGGLRTSLPFETLCFEIKSGLPMR